MIKRLARLLADSMVERCYLFIGAWVGEAVSTMPVLGEPVGFEVMVRQWRFWEAEYIRRGYRSIPLDTFEDMGGHGIEPAKVGKKMEEDEMPIFHAARFRRRYFSQPKPGTPVPKTSGRA